MAGNTKGYRFFYHYRRSDKKMSIHFKKQCIVASEVICNVSCETKRNKIQPYLVLQGFCNTVEVINDKIIIK